MGRPESARTFFATARIQDWVSDHYTIGTDRSFIRGLSPNQTPSHQLQTLPRRSTEKELDTQDYIEVVFVWQRYGN